MTGWAARGHSIRVVRTCIELTVFAIGWALGGSVGIGTVVYALAIGPLAHVVRSTLRDPAAGGRAGSPRGTDREREVALVNLFLGGGAPARPGASTSSPAASALEIGEVLGEDLERALAGERSAVTGDHGGGAVHQRREPEQRLPVGLERAAVSAEIIGISTGER